MSSTTVSSTQQQDRIASSNSSQMRRGSADHKAAQGASPFANLLQQASEPAETETDISARELFETDPKADAQAPNAADWLALAQALNGGRGNLSTPIDAADSGLNAARQTAATDGNQPLSTGPEVTAADETLPVADAEATEAQAGTTPRRTPAKAAGAAALAAAASAAAAGAGVGAPARNDAPAAVAAAVLAGTPAATQGGAALPASAALQAATQGVRAAMAAEENTGTLDTPTGGLERLLATPAESGGAPQTDVQAGTDGQGGTESRSDTELAQATDTPAWGERWGEAMDDVGHQVSYWLGRGVKQAQIQVEAGLERPLEVAVSLDKGQAVLHFLTDDSAARTAIEQGAADALRQALSRDGIGLAGLSVGSQGRQDQPQGQSAHAGRPGERSDNAAAEAAPRTPQRQSSRVLDLYA